MKIAARLLKKTVSTDNMLAMDEPATIPQLRAKLRKGLRLTPGERLVVKRQRGNYTQRVLAHELKVGVDKLRAWEQDLAVAPKVKGIRVESLTLQELLTVHRRRLGLRIAYLARVMDKSVGWVHRAHTGEHVESAERLTNFILTRAGRA